MLELRQPAGGWTCSWATATGRSSPPSITRGRKRTRSRSWRASFGGDGLIDLAVTNSGDDDVLDPDGERRQDVQTAVDCAGGGTPLRSRRGISRQRLSSTWPSTDAGRRTTVSILMGKGDGTFRARRPIDVGWNPDAIVAGDFGGDGIVDLAVAEPAARTRDQCSILKGDGKGTSQPAGAYAVGRCPTRWWRVISAATANSTWPSTNGKP